jgi:hypothetical protein
MDVIWIRQEGQAKRVKTAAESMVFGTSSAHRLAPSSRSLSGAYPIQLDIRKVAERCSSTEGPGEISQLDMGVDLVL